MTSETSKDALRAGVRSRRATRAARDISNLSHSASRHLVDFLDTLGPRSVAIFLSSAHELQTHDVIAHLSDAGVTVWAPHSLDHGVLHWSEISRDTPVSTGPFGIPEPASSVESRRAHIEPDMVICPAALVDRHGTRLGWGKGYYDRFLATLGAHAPVVAVVFDDEVVDELPREAHDVPVTHLATPSGVRSVTAET